MLETVAREKPNSMLHSRSVGPLFVFCLFSLKQLRKSAQVASTIVSPTIF